MQYRAANRGGGTRRANGMPYADNVPDRRLRTTKDADGRLVADRPFTKPSSGTVRQRRRARNAAARASRRRNR